jgi:4-hydroxybenzoyl-CoA reductase subunit beta
MEALPRFQVLRPETAAEAARMRRDDPEARYLAGGTDLIVNVRRGIETPTSVIDISQVRELTAIETTEDGGLRIGAAVTLEALIAHEAVNGRFPVIAEAAATIAAHSHRIMGTVGGNLCLDTRCLYYNQSEWWRTANNYCLKHRGEICHVAPKSKRCFAAFSGDLAPALLVLGAQVEVTGADGTATRPLQDLYRDDGADHLALAEGELLSAVTVPGEAAGLAAGYDKVRVRGGIDFPLTGIAAGLRRDGDTLAELRVALTGVGSIPILLDGTADFAGGPLDEDALDRLDRMVSKQIQPMHSTLTPAKYRRKVSIALARRLVQRLYSA